MIGQLKRLGLLALVLGSVLLAIWAYLSVKPTSKNVPGNQTIYLEGIDALRTGDMNRAIDLFSRHLTLAPGDPSRTNVAPDFVLTLRAQAKGRLNDVAGQLADAAEALRINPSSRYARLERVSGFMTQGDYPAALREIETAKAMLARSDIEDPMLAAHRGRVLEKMGRSEEAKAAFDEAVSMDGKNAIMFQERGNFFARLGDVRAAISDYAETVRLSPGVPGPLHSLRSLCSQVPQPDIPAACKDLPN
jgi:tetratricopeptide (TPR) repeat protein